ncbi:MAG: DNA polymerase III subunit alpha [Brevinematales bacterium]|nr:DNA polymerase III subunit alpha [Brevinematales bacterium]
MKNFVHLHNHSHYSILDGVSKIDEIIKKTKEEGFSSVAITEHGNLFSSMEFYKECKKYDVKPIIGCEVYISPKSRFEKDKDEKYHHLVLLAKDIEGYKNLMKISSIGYIEGFYYKPRVDKEILSEYSKGLVVLTACLGGEIPRLILSNASDSILNSTIDWYIQTFGKENFFLEIQNHKIQEELIVTKKILELSKKFNLKVVATNDSHYISRDDAKLQEIVFAVRDKTTLKDPKRQVYPTDEFYYKSYEEMYELFKEIPETLSNTKIIEEMCNLTLKLNEKHTPIYPLPHGEDAFSYLTKLCNKGLEKKFNGNIPLEYKERLELELNLINQMGFSNYFLIVADFVNEAKERGILVGPGRGSAAGALLSYALGITEVDPIKYQLLFERFLNPERVSMPDIDVDFQDDRRDEIKEYIRTKYGYNNTADIITFGVLKARAALKDVGRVLDIPLEKVNKITKMIDNKTANEPLSEVVEQIPELKILKTNGSKEEKEWIEYSIRLDGTVRNIGTHASGLIISDVPLSEVVPLYKDQDSGIISTQFEGTYLEENGLLKMDILGLSNLTIIQDCLKRIQKNHHIKIDLNQIPLDDQNVFKLFWNGETAGIFQFESVGMTEYLKQLKPTTIEDLIAMNALYRPGPMENIPKYIARKHGLEEIDCYHEDLEPILKPTFGIIVYQEQVMQIAQVLAGFSLGKADIVRRIMAKKKPEELEKIKPEWIEGAISRGYSRELAEKLFDILVPFSNYAFNKSHSAAYAILAYQIAYLKTYYKIEFMASLLSMNMGDSDSVRKYCEECNNSKIKILPPDINLSEWEFKEENGKIIFGFGAVKGLGEVFVKAIIDERNMGGKFTSFENFLERMQKKEDFKKNYIEILIKAGAFDSLTNENECLKQKSEWLNKFEHYISHRENVEREMKKGNQYLFGEEILECKDIKKESKVISLKDEFLYEFEVFGFYLSKKIFNHYEKKFGIISRISKEHIDKLENTNFLTFGFISEMDVKIASNNKPYAILNIDNGTDIFKFMLFSEKYERFSSILKTKEFVFIRFKTLKNNDNIQYELLDIKNIDRLTEEKFTEFHIYVDEFKTDFDDVEKEIKNFKKWIELPEMRGTLRIFLHLIGQNKSLISFSDRYNIRYNKPLVEKIINFPFVDGIWLY